MIRSIADSGFHEHCGHVAGSLSSGSPLPRGPFHFCVSPRPIAAWLLYLQSPGGLVAGAHAAAERGEPHLCISLVSLLRPQHVPLPDLSTNQEEDWVAWEVSSQHRVENPKWKELLQVRIGRNLFDSRNQRPSSAFHSRALIGTERTCISLPLVQKQCFMQPQNQQCVSSPGHQTRRLHHRPQRQPSPLILINIQRH